MSIIIPTIEKYQVCKYTHHSMEWSLMKDKEVQETLAKRKFIVIEEFNDLEDARKFMAEKELEFKQAQEKPWHHHECQYVIQFVFKEIEPDETVH